jgi:MSHA biogenesis protein MshP
VNARGTRRSRGFALIAALFLLVVVALLGTFAARVNASQEGSGALDLAGVRADAALQAGIQYAAERVLAAGCGGLPGALPLAQNFSVAFDNCQQLPNPVANVPSVNVFSVRATATRGQYGSPDFVSRQRTVRITP